MVSDPIFTGKDLELIESLVYDPDLEPGYDMIKSCLIWGDEKPAGISPRGYSALCDLWISRSFLHLGKAFSEDEIDPEYFGKFWARAMEQNFKWPGFKRLTLSEEDRAYYKQSIGEVRFEAGEEEAEPANAEPAEQEEDRQKLS